MEFEIRRIDKNYVEVKATIDNLTYNIGFLSEVEAKSLASVFESVIDELTEGWE